jgi:8-oxo-dGTP pyrophosphatase MutT (NUDIX family)
MRPRREARPGTERVGPDDLRRALVLGGVEAAAAQAPMVPPRRGRPPDVAPGTPLRAAAALAYVCARDGALRFPLTLRREDLREHRGQVSLPGGRPEPGEDLWTTALREAREEIGVRTEGLERVGVLSPVVIPHTHTSLHVHVALGPDPGTLVPQASEVARIEWAVLDDLIDPARRGAAVRRIDGEDVAVPCFLLAGFEVWGATAIALQDLAHRLERAMARP